VQGWSRKKKKMLIEKCYDKLPAFSTAYRDKINLDSKIHIEPSVNLITESKVVEALETTRNNQ
ncbi:MAG: hypothetical protein PHF25_09090, partial [Candidatus Margulisbacteria bacterium]|nr:hypothetical protein [Candidatus Margulisiibacteriota bacterium]